MWVWVWEGSRLFILTVVVWRHMNRGSYVLDLRLVQRGVFDTMIHVKPSGTGEEGKKISWNHVFTCCKLIPADSFRGLVVV